MICPKCCWKSEAVAQPSSVKMRFCKASQISQKGSKMESLFRKVLKRTLSLAFSFEYIYVNIFFHFYFFVSGKKKAATGDVLRIKVFLKVSQENRKTPVLVSLFKIKLQVFKNTYFEELLWTTASKKINICSIVKVLLLRRIKLLKSSVNKKKKHVRKFDVRSHVATVTHKFYGKRFFLLLPAKENARGKKEIGHGKKRKKSTGKRKILAAKEKCS